MIYSTRDAAEVLNISQRQVQRIARSASASTKKIAGRTLLSSRDVVAAERTVRAGRAWNDQTARAALELLESGTTSLIVGTERSRLKARLRSMQVGQLAHQILGKRAAIFRNARNDSGQLQVLVTSNTAAIARADRLFREPDGNTVVIEIDTETQTVLEEIVEYTYADARFSAIARTKLMDRMAAL